MGPAHDLSRVAEYVSRPPWDAVYQLAMEQHLGHVLDTFGLEEMELLEVLGPERTGRMISAVMEDLLTRAAADGGPTLAEVYLKARGWRETPSCRAYLRALKGSAQSLYEVLEVDPGRSFLARDLLRGGEPVRVSDVLTSPDLAPGDQAGVRVISLAGRPTATPCVLPLRPEAADGFLEALRLSATKRAARAEEGGADPRLAGTAPLFTVTWLLGELHDEIPAVLPQVRNRDGDEIVFHTLRFPLAPKTAAKTVSARLEALPQLHRAGRGLWAWLEASPTGVGAGADEVSVEIEDPLGRIELGSFELAHREVILRANSAARAERGTALLEGVLGPLVGAPFREVMTLAEARARGPGPETEPLPLEVATELTHAALDRHYRETLDAPVPMLGGETPRALAQTPEGRSQVASWLDYLERTSAAAGPEDPVSAYDFGWIWRELGLADLRG